MRLEIFNKPLCLGRMLGLILNLLYLPLHILKELVYFILRCRPKKAITNEHILITGAGQGIGAEFARQFADMGNTVHCVDIDTALVESVVNDLKKNGHSAYSYTCDLTKHEQVQQLYDDVTKTGHSITYLVNNAGVVFGMKLTSMTLTQIQHSLTVNLTSNLWLIKLFLPSMVKQNYGHVVNIASLAGIFPLENSTDYCAAKAASIHTMEQLRADHVSSKLKFTVVCPSYVKTKMTDGVPDYLKMSAGALVQKAVAGIREEREIVCVPNWSRVIIFLKSI